MNLKEQLNQEWDRFLSSGANRGSIAIQLDIPDGRFACELVGIDRLACAFERAVFSTSRLEQSSVDELKRVAEELSKRLSYLLESISPVEIDGEECVVQMRSMPPLKDDEGTSYYEIMARRGELSLSRYTKPDKQSRRLVPAHVTREVFLRLAQDLTSLPGLGR